MASESTAEAVGSFVGRVCWAATGVLFIFKVTGYKDPSWVQVLLPGVGSFLVGIAVILLGLALEAAGEARSRKRYDARRHHDVSHIEPLDSIKNPRKS